MQNYHFMHVWKHERWNIDYIALNCKVKLWVYGIYGWLTSRQAHVNAMCIKAANGQHARLGRANEWWVAQPTGGAAAQDTRENEVTGHYTYTALICWPCAWCTEETLPHCQRHAHEWLGTLWYQILLVSLPVIVMSNCCQNKYWLLWCNRCSLNIVGWQFGVFILWMTFLLINSRKLQHEWLLC